MHASDELDMPAQGAPGWDRTQTQADGEEDVGVRSAVWPCCFQVVGGKSFTAQGVLGGACSA